MASDKDMNGHVSITLNKPGRILHFSDGVEEEVEQNKVEDLNATQSQKDVDPKTLAWGPWLSYKAWASGTKILNAVDYAGEGLANFFGITTPKYQLEISEHERIQEENRKLDEESAGWVTKNGGGDIPLVLNEPVRN